MMNLKVKIHNKVFKNKLVQGCTFTEEYTETLDSGSIILAQVPKIKNLQPYDDVYIYDGEFEGFDKNGNVIGNCTFYKHLLVDSFSEERLNLQSNVYKYKIQLFSETKGLETIQLPNISITQPLNIEKKISIYDYMKQFINMYSPKIKVATDVDNQIWEYKPKYKLSEQWVDLLDEGEFDRKTMQDIFAHSYTPDFSLNNPNLKDVLAKLMIVKDRIPVVYNNVIYAMDITKRRKKFNFDKGQINFIAASNSSSNFADNLKRTYLDALSQDRTCKMVEYLGFRNRDTALMKLSDLRIETSFPIYKINKIYMCYYKKVKIFNIHTSSEIGKGKAFLCKQDITPLVKLNSERNLLSKDWDDFEDEISNYYDLNDLSKYKMATIGYDIGSNHISGWGEKYSYTKGWWKTEKTYIENIFYLLDILNPYGVYGENYITQKSNLNSNERLVVSNFDENNVNSIFNNVISPYSNNSLKLKGFFFEVEYDAFYNGTVIHTKDLATGDTMMLDNPSASLSLLEMDGLAQKEKINRFGNKNYTIPARYTDFSQLQGLGNYYDDDENDTDIIIYRKEYSINGNVINCTYQGMKDYVLKNYFTNVYAKHRPYNLMSYGESITRAENKKVMFFLSKSKKYFEKQKNIIFNDFNYFSDFFSFFRHTYYTEIVNEFKNDKQINYGYLELKSPIYDEDGNIVKNEDGSDKYEFKNYASDLNAFVNGNSMCFNMKMTDNVSMGVYVKKAMPFENDENFNPIKDFIDPKDDYTGTLQTWYMTTDDIETGFAREIGFYVGHSDKDNAFLDLVVDLNEETFISFGKTGNYKNNTSENILLNNLQVEDVEGAFYSKLTGGFIEVKLKDKEELLIETYANNFYYKITYTINEEEKVIEVSEDSNFSFICDNENGLTLKIEPITLYDETENRFYSIRIKNEISYNVESIYNHKLFTLPKIEKENFNLTNIIGNRFEINKDNKEIIDMTYQFEPITDDDDIMFSPWMMKLSDLIGNYNKFDYDDEVDDIIYKNGILEMYATTTIEIYLDNVTSWNNPNPTFILSVDKNNLDDVKPNAYLGNEIFFFDVIYPNYLYFYNTYDIFYSFSPNRIKEVKYKDINGDLHDNYVENSVLYYIIIEGTQKVTRQKPFGVVSKYSEIVELKLENITLSGDSMLDWNKIPSDKFYLSNVKFYWHKDAFGEPISRDSSLIEPIKFNYGKEELGNTSGGKVLSNGKHFDPWKEESNNDKNLLNTMNSDKKILPLSDENGNVLAEKQKYKYLKNMFLVLDDQPLKKNLVYEEYKCLQENEVLEEGKRKDFLGKVHNCKELKPGDYLKVEYENDIPYLSIVLPVMDKPYQSVQLWYLDNIENGVEPDFSKASYKFVFGVNVSQEEKNNYETRIYISELSTLNKKVYDQNYNLIGNVTDFGENLSQTYGQQHYTPFKEEEAE